MIFTLFLLRYNAYATHMRSAIQWYGSVYVCPSVTSRRSE